jgi:hypothetical protein
MFSTDLRSHAEKARRVLVRRSTPIAPAPDPSPYGCCTCPWRTGHCGCGRTWKGRIGQGPHGSGTARLAGEHRAPAAGGHVVESTSGNMGIALAGMCAERGYRCTLVVDDVTCAFSLDRMAELGAELIRVPAGNAAHAVSARIETVHHFREAHPRAVWTDQYEGTIHAPGEPVTTVTGSPSTGGPPACALPPTPLAPPSRAPTSAPDGGRPRTYTAVTRSLPAAAPWQGRPRASRGRRQTSTGSLGNRPAVSGQPAFQQPLGHKAAEGVPLFTVGGRKDGQDRAPDTGEPGSGGDEWPAHATPAATPGGPSVPRSTSSRTKRLGLLPHHPLTGL